MTAMMPTRGKLQGLLQIILYNWTFYAISSFVCAAGIFQSFFLTLTGVLQIAIYIGISLALFWTISSLLVSYYVYDYSPLYRWHWLEEFFPKAPKRWLNLHCGLDESSEALRVRFFESVSVIGDFYHPEYITEASILRARRYTPSSIPAIRFTSKAFPFARQVFDAAFCIFTAHELRQRELRLQYFYELHRVLQNNGKLLLVEHLRNVSNFLAFGPGVLHFFSQSEWQKLAKESGFRLLKTRSLTPFVNIFLFERSEKNYEPGISS